MKTKFKTVYVASALITFAIACLGLLGYLPGLELLGSVKENSIPIAPSIAVSFVLLVLLPSTF